MKKCGVMGSIFSAPVLNVFKQVYECFSRVSDALPQMAHIVWGSSSDKFTWSVKTSRSWGAL